VLFCKLQFISGLQIPGAGKGLETTVVSLFHLVRETAGGQLPTLQMITEALTTDSLMRTTGISAITKFQVLFLFTFHSYIPLWHFVQPLRGCKFFVNFTTGFGLRPAPAAIIVMTPPGSGKLKHATGREPINCRRDACGTLLLCFDAVQGQDRQRQKYNYRQRDKKKLLKVGTDINATAGE
jgi:hypothetical protein